VTNYSDLDSTPASPPPPPGRRLPLPLSNPFLTYVLLGLIVIIWLLMELSGGSQNPQVLVRFGANFGPLILNGETWRLFTSMFLHIGLAHLFFNSYALFIFGLEMERLYGSDRYIIIYILSGLFGSLASFASRGPQVFSAGASGAIFGVIGMNLAYFLLHRETFGRFGRQRVMNTLFIIGINLVFGFTIPGIDNLAHLGGLVSGFVLGYGLAPRYQVVDEYTLNPRVIDTVSLVKRWWIPTLAIILLAGGVTSAISVWSLGG
jgi:membrane associated rhomboid family serine protease